MLLPSRYELDRIPQRRDLENHGNRGLDRDINLLPLACHLPVVEGQRCPHRALGRGIKIRLGVVAYPDRRTIIITGDIHPAAHGERYDVGGLEVPVGAGLPKRTYGYHDYTGIDLLQFRVSQAKAVHVSRWKGFYNEISPLNQFLEELLPLFGLDVEGYPPLAGIIGPPEKTVLRTGFIVVEGSDLSGGIATRFFNLDDVDPEVAEDLAK